MRALGVGKRGWRAALCAIAATVACCPVASVGESRLGSGADANYASRIRNRIAWESFPVEVCFVRDANYSEAKQKRALLGLARWVSASGGVIRYHVSAKPAEAQIAVRFDPSNNDGYTTTSFTDGQITSASVRIGVKRGAGRDMEAIAAHEFGHALGLDGHSDVKSDLMFPVHHMGTPYRITARDLNTLATLYPQIGKQMTADSTR